MKQYLTLLQDILDKGTWKAPARENLPPTLSLFGTRMEFDMKDGFPLLTTKEVYFKGIVVELLWFLKGDTNIKYLVDNGVSIWNEDAYRWYLKVFSQYPAFDPMSIENFIGYIKAGELTTLEENYKLGDLGKVYGHQWRDQDGIDQVQTVLDRLQNKPEERYAILDAWHPADFDEMALPPCHLLYQFNGRERQFTVDEAKNMTENTPRYYLDLQMYQRSCDTFHGVPFNIASGATFLKIIAKYLNMVPGKFIWIGGDTHIYKNHMEAVREQLSRTPGELPKLYITDFIDLGQLQYKFFDLVDYKPQGKIKAEFNSGLKK